MMSYSVDQHVLVQLRQRGRTIGEQEYTKSKVKRNSRGIEPEPKSNVKRFSESAQNWCETYSQVNDFLDFVESHFLPMFTDKKMNGAPKVQALRENDSYTSQDEKLVKEWTSSL